jgi:hypothetical protein
MSIATATRIQTPLPAHSEPTPTSPPTDHSPEAVAEEHRWLMMLVTPFILSAALFAAAVGTGYLWLMGPAMVLGPGLIIIGFVYLGLTSDTNGRAVGPA